MRAHQRFAARMDAHDTRSFDAARARHAQSQCLYVKSGRVRGVVEREVRAVRYARRAFADVLHDTMKRASMIFCHAVTPRCCCHADVIMLRYRHADAARYAPRCFTA